MLSPTLGPVPESPRPDLTGRVAWCGGRVGAHGEQPSSRDLAFFEYCGPGSRDADRCECGFARVAHEHQPRNVRPESVVERGLCGGYRQREASATDRYYCGCRGWD